MARGRLYIAATPIGNLEDITLRAVRVLGEVDFIASEDTRRAGRLLSRYDIKTPVVGYSRGRNKRQAARIIERISKGEDAVLITNAGTPGVSDPGPELVRDAAAQGISVQPLPGPCAFSAAVSVSGMPSSNFVFLGYLSPKSGRRRKELRRFAGSAESIVLYESPHRLRRLLEDIRDELGERHLVICRELTKKFEETLRGGVSELIELFERKEPRGEFTVMISMRKEKGHE